MVAAAVAVDLRAASHLACADQHDLVGKAACGEVFDQRTDGVVERRPGVAQAFLDTGIVLVAVHVPHEIRGNRDQSATRLAEPSGQQQQFAERLGIVDVVAAVVPLAADGLWANQRRGIVAVDRLPVFARQIECRGRAAQHGLKSLLAQRVDGGQRAGRVERKANAVELGQNRPAVGQPLERQVQPHVGFQRTAGAGHERRAAGAELASALQPAEGGRWRSGRRIDRAGK